MTTGIVSRAYGRADKQVACGAVSVPILLFQASAEQQISDVKLGAIALLRTCWHIHTQLHQPTHIPARHVTYEGTQYTPLVQQLQPPQLASMPRVAQEYSGR